MQFPSFADIQRIKQLAKQAAKTHPHLSHSARLNLMAVEHGYRSFHELTRLRDKAIMQHVKMTDTDLAVCTFCGLNFAPSVDKKEHQRRHEQFEEAVAALNYMPDGHAARESKKKEAYRRVHDSSSIENQVQNQLIIFRAWFDRSLEAAINSGYWKNHPGFERYVSMIVGHIAMRESLRPLLMERFGNLDGEIEPGHSYWYPKR